MSNREPPFEAVPAEAYPLALAPIATITAAAAAVAEKDRLREFEEWLGKLSGADEAHIDGNDGSFEFAFAGEALTSALETEDRSFTQSTSRVRFCPFELTDQSAPTILSRLTDDQRHAVKIANDRIWGAMLDGLGALVDAGASTIVARERSPLARRFVAIPPRVWTFFRIEDWATGTALCTQTGERLFDVHLTRPTLEQKGRRGLSGKGRKAAIDWLVGERRKGPAKGTKAEYQTEANKLFGLGPWQFQDVWREAASLEVRDDWGRPGRPTGNTRFQSIG